MSFFESIISAIFVMAVVFIVLVCLYVIMKLFSYGISKLEAASNAKE